MDWENEDKGKEVEREEKGEKHLWMGRMKRERRMFRERKKRDKGKVY